MKLPCKSALSIHMVLVATLQLYACKASLVPKLGDKNGKDPSSSLETDTGVRPSPSPDPGDRRSEFPPSDSPSNTPALGIELAWVTTLADQILVKGTPLSVPVVAASGGDPKVDLTFSLDPASTCDKGAWSPNISLNSATGVLSGTPTYMDIGNCTIKIVATRGAESISQTFTITISGTAPTISLANAAGFQANVYCPRLDLSAQDIPSEAAEFCIRENSSSTTGCVWGSLPMPSTVRAVSTSGPVTFSLWLRDTQARIFHNAVAVTSNAVVLSPTVLPPSSAAWTGTITNAALTAPQIDELTCRIDELNGLHGLRLAGARAGAMTNAKRGQVSRALNQVIDGNLGVTSAMSSAEAQKAIWRLMITAAAKSTPLDVLDLSRIDLSGHNLSGLDFTNTNISGSQLSTAGSLGARPSLAQDDKAVIRGLDLTGWAPSTTLDLSGIDFTGCTNIPWNAINANTNASGFKFVNFSGVDLTGFSPAASSNLSYLKLNNATNVPWAAINANTNIAGLANADLNGLNLSGFNPPTSMNITGLNLVGSTNIPWSAINSNSGGFSNANLSGLNLTGFNPPPAMGITGLNLVGATNIPWAAFNASTGGIGWSDLRGLDLSGFSPASSQYVAGIKFGGATNIPWVAINANTESLGFFGTDFSSTNLAGFNPAPSVRVDGMNLSMATNIPWAAINANTHGNGLRRVNLSHLDLTGFNPPPAMRLYDFTLKAGVDLSYSTNIPWAAIAANTAFFGFGSLSGANLTGCDLTGFNPPGTFDVSHITLTGATNIPWSAIQDNLAGSDLSYTDLSGFNPTSGANSINIIDFSGATNIPWAALIANGGLSQNKFAYLNLSALIPAANFNYSFSSFTGATNIPWSGLNASTNSQGSTNTNFSGLDLSLFAPPTNAAISSTDFSNASMINWVSINSNTTPGFLSNSKLIGVDLVGLNPTGKTLNGAKMPIGARSPSDFVDATESTPGPSTTWIDGTKPWGL